MVILSDMVEENKEINFNKTALTQEDVSAIIKNRQSQNLLPKLSGMKIFAAGASAKSDETYMRIKNFWMR